MTCWEYCLYKDSSDTNLVLWVIKIYEKFTKNVTKKQKKYIDFWNKLKLNQSI